jgi:hypothetical protein
MMVKVLWKGGPGTYFNKSETFYHQIWETEKLLQKFNRITKNFIKLFGRVIYMLAK